MVTYCFGKNKKKYFTNIYKLYNINKESIIKESTFNIIYFFFGKIYY
jgi:hypothetical protein